jgi:hypothetical protein
MKTKTYDFFSYLLATRFLKGLPIDSDKNREALAAHIQTEIEEWIVFEEEEAELERKRSQKTNPGIDAG